MKKKINNSICSSVTTRKKASSYLSGYGICPSYRSNGENEEFVKQSNLTINKWIKNPNGTDVELGGYWRNPSFMATTGNYFIVETINKEAVSSEEVEDRLLALTSQYISKENPLYNYGFVCFAGNSNRGYQYPALSTKQEQSISANENIFDYLKVLRYAFASTIAYSRESEKYPFADNEYYRTLMLNGGKLEVVDELRGGTHGVWAVAIKVPKIEEVSLEEEIIIAYKGTSNKMDGWNDVKLSIQNFIEKNAGWQKEAFDFCYKVIKAYPPNKASIQKGYKPPFENGSNNVVLTGHSLGGYAAIQTSVRLGILTRTFSSPATKIINEYVNLFSESLYFNNCVNFVREKDPIVALSGRHSENMVYYPGANGIDPFSSHYLNPFIEDVILPLVTESSVDRGLYPVHMHITPQVVKGAGINQSINVWR